MQKIITGFVFLVFLLFGIFFYFYFSGNERVKEVMGTILPESFLNFTEKMSLTGDFGINGVVSRKSDGGELTVEGIIRETNQRRENLGYNALVEDGKLNNTASKKIDDMFEKQYFAHISPEGEGVGDIAGYLGYEFILIGDNLAMGNYSDDADVVNAWMDSPGHRKNILDQRYEKIGVSAREGEYEGKKIWMAVQVFSLPLSSCPKIDDSLEKKIEDKKDEINFVLMEIERIKEAIDDTERGSDLHIEKSEEYRELAQEYNLLLSEYNEIINDYNNQMKEREKCIEEKTSPHSF